MEDEKITENMDEEKTEEKPEPEKIHDKGAKKEIEALKNELDSVKTELGLRNDSYLRISAEYDNYRKRTAAEKAASYAEAYAYAAEMFLPMADALDRAAEMAPEDKGIEILKKQLSDIFTKLGITAIESDGKPFDPALHNAIMHDEDEEKPENMVVQTLQRGYMLGDKIIRHAMVKVVN